METTRNLCITAPERRFEPGAPLVVDACDGMRAVRDRVFARDGEALVIAGRPDVCIGVQRSGGRLALEPCGANALKWSFDDAAQVVRSAGGLCWRLPRGFAAVRGPAPVVAAPCGAGASAATKLWLTGD